MGTTARISLLCIMTLILISVPILAQTQGKPLEEQRVNNLTYQRFADGWYTSGVNGMFKVSNTSVTARMLSSDSRTRVESMLDTHNLELLRENHLGILDIRVPAGDDPLDVVAELKATDLFRYVETNSIGRWSELANDIYFNSQWGHYNTGQTGGTPDADIDCTEAWDIEKGNPGAVVAILDSGTDTDHEDLINNMWNNTDEIPGNGNDDDNNGYTDDILGWDFENDDNDPNGSFWHGTHVAGIVAATSNNGVGVSGVAGGWGSDPGAQLMCILVGSDSPIGEILDDAILYAADNGAHVITMSLTVEFSQAIVDAAEYALNTKHAFLDCASGNDSGAVGFPANVAHIAAIGATDDSDNRASFSNYGSELELTAPGVDIWSTQIGNTYASSDGTSFAAPYAAGVAALVFSAAPGVTGAEVRTLLQNTSDDLGSTGWDQYYGHGRVNAAAALAEVSGIYFDRDAYACQSTLNILVRDNGASGSVNIAVSSGTEPGGETVNLTETSAGVFEGSVLCDNISPVPGDGTVSVADMDTLTAYYAALDKNDTAPVDCVTPAISNVTVDMVGFDTATISWTTDEPCNSQVSYGILIPTEIFQSDVLTTYHVVVLNGLLDCSDYVFYVTSDDAAGNSVTDDNGGINYGFITNELVVLFEENMESDPMWEITGGDWEWGVPLGYDDDPTSGYTGNNVYGYNLSGDYVNNLPAHYLVTPAFDCTGATQVFFSFYRWLGVESSTWDHAAVSVSGNNGSTWTVLWENPSSLMSDSNWVYEEYDISSIAGNASQVKIRWQMGSTDGTVIYCGWNIDDVIVSYSIPCTGGCNNDGDVTLDGSVTAGDAQLGFSIALGGYTPTPEEECAADCNGDGGVTAGDAQGIFAMALGSGSCVDPL